MIVPALIIDKALLKRIEGYASRGLSLPKIAGILGIHIATLHKYKNKHPEINEAWRRGKYKGEAEVASALFEKAIEGSVDAQKYYLSRQGGKEWREEVDVNLIPKPTIIERFNSDKEVVLGASEYKEIEDDDE